MSSTFILLHFVLPSPNSPVCLSLSSFLFCLLFASLSFPPSFIPSSLSPSLFLTCPPPHLLSLPLSAQSSAAQLAWFSGGVVKYKYNKDVFELVNPFWAEKHHHRAHRCGTRSGERETERDGEREEEEKKNPSFDMERVQQEHWKHYCWHYPSTGLVIRTLHTNLTQVFVNNLPASLWSWISVSPQVLF